MIRATSTVEHTPIPVCIYRAAVNVVRRAADGAEYRTDQGNMILDCDFGPIAGPAQLAGQLDRRAGIVEHGLFIGLAHLVVVSGPDGVRELRPA
jgi:ribose 5-phosphate isomerase A